MQIDTEKYPAIRKLVHGAPSPQPVAAEPRVPGWVDYASWLSPDILLIVGWFHVEEAALSDVSLVLGDHAIPLKTQCLSYPRADVPGDDPRPGKVLTARFLDAKCARRSPGKVMIRTGKKTVVLGPSDLSQAVSDLRTLAHYGLAGLDAATRLNILDFLTSAVMEQHGTANGIAPSKSLFTIREALRQHLPLCVIAPDQPQGLHIDTFVAVDETSFYIRGWARDGEAKITHLTAISPEGGRAELLESTFRYPRPDVEQYYGAQHQDQLAARSGFISYFQVKTPSRLTSGWTIEMRNTAGNAVEMLAPGVIGDSITVRSTLLADLVYERFPGDELMRNHIFPAISRLQERHRQVVKIESVEQYGQPAVSAEVSIIVPLYQRIDFLEQQLAQFVHDPEIHEADLIYVLDSPELEQALRQTAAQLFRLYRIPFRVAILSRNGGFAAANNAGASLARGRLLLLLNSDVLPDRPGWLGAMTRFYDATPGIGALGAKLLFEDESLQHAGMYFYRPAGARLWENMHYFKGLHRCLPAANVCRPVPAVTAACLMIDGERYQQLGGLQGSYVQGDYEDSDLCLRLIEAGFENWYLPQAELYHLEGQSYSLSWRQLNGQYNAWLHTHLWNQRIEAVMARYASWIVGRSAVVHNC